VNSARLQSPRLSQTDTKVLTQCAQEWCILASWVLEEEVQQDLVRSDPLLPFLVVLPEGNDMARPSKL